MSDFFSLIFVIFIALIPILIWGYLFSYLDNREFNRKNFSYWILAWFLSVFPVLYLWDFIEKSWFDFLNIFSKAYNLSDFNNTILLFISLFSFLIFVSILPLFLNIFKKDKEEFKIILKNTLIFIISLFIISIIFLLIKKIFWRVPYFSNWVKDYPEFWKIIFNSVLLVVIYYLIIGLLEELSKFLSFNYAKTKIIWSVKEWVLFSIFVALWFAFIENILYLKTIYQNYSIWKEFFSVYISRNLFSVFLHIIASSIFSYFFSKAYLSSKKFSEYFKLILFWFILSVFVHAVFNISLTLDFTLITILYLFWGYFYISYIFYSK